MIVKYLSKFVLEVLPSVVATIIGAYIVNHYITKPAAEVPVAAAVSTVEPKTVDPKKTDAKESETPSDVASAPDSGAAKKSSTDEAAAEKGSVDKGSVDKGLEKSADKPTQTAAFQRKRDGISRQSTTGRSRNSPVPTGACGRRYQRCRAGRGQSAPGRSPRCTEMARAASNGCAARARLRAPDAARVQDLPAWRPPGAAAAPIMVSTPPSGNAYNRTQQRR